MFTYYYNKVRQHPLNSFWGDVLESEEFLDLTNEDSFTKSKETALKSCNSISDSSDETKGVNGLTESTCLQKTEPSTEDCTASTSKRTEDEVVITSDCDIVVNSDSDSSSQEQGFKDKFRQDTSDQEFFNIGRTLGTQDYIGQRVLQIATILRNLSFIDENITLLAKNETFIRFLILCSSARWGHLHNLGLDMLGNIASEYLIKDLQIDRLSACLIRLITEGLQNEDRTFCIASLDALNKLSQIEANEDVLARSLDPCVYQRVCSFLTLHDVMLLVYTLECLYSLSSLGERPCNLIVNIHGVIDTLVSLVTVEGKSYGPKACIGMKLVETVPGGGTTNSAAQGTSTITTSSTSAASNSSTTTTNTTTTVASVVASVPSSPSCITLTPTKTVITNTPTRPVQITPQRVILTPTATATCKPKVEVEVKKLKD